MQAARLDLSSSAGKAICLPLRANEMQPMACKVTIGREHPAFFREIRQLAFQRLRSRKTMSQLVPSSRQAAHSFKICKSSRGDQ